MDMVSKYGLMEPATKASGETTSHAEEANSSTLTAMSMMANGQMIKPTDTEFTLTQMARATRVTGKTTSNTESAKRHGLTVASTTGAT